MNIVTYRELEPKDDFMMLMDLAFWWPIPPDNMEEWINMDARLKGSPVGFCAVEDGKLVGHVGVMDIPTKTVDGKVEIVGGIWAVATNPGFSRRGICKILMEKAHDYFRSQNYRFSFLCTGRTIIAYSIYKNMGYEEVESVNHLKAAYKVFHNPKAQEKSMGGDLDADEVYRIYEKFTQDKTGFVVRQRDFATVYAKRKRFDDKISIPKPDGYVLLSESQKVIKVRDMAGLNYDIYGELIDEIERLVPHGVIDGSVADETLLGLYRSKGYRLQKGHNGVLMVKKLKDVQFDKLYGSSFYIGALDWF
jgi:predicted acetyltransferase